MEPLFNEREFEQNQRKNYQHQGGNPRESRLTAPRKEQRCRHYKYQKCGSNRGQASQEAAGIRTQHASGLFDGSRHVQFLKDLEFSTT
jgi:hypothetical protein